MGNPDQGPLGSEAVKVKKKRRGTRGRKHKSQESESEIKDNIQNCTTLTENRKRNFAEKKFVSTKENKTVGPINRKHTVNQSSNTIKLNFEIHAIQDGPGTAYRLRNYPQQKININGLINKRIETNNVAIENVAEKLKGIELRDKTVKNKTNRKLRRSRKSKDDNSTSEEEFSAFLSETEIEYGLKYNLLIKGYIRINPKNGREAYVSNTDASKQDYIIQSVVDRNRALDGDEVVIKPKLVVENRNTAEVVAILTEIHPRHAVGVLKPLVNNKEYADFYPRDIRIPKIRIPKIFWPLNFESDPKLYENILFMAKINKWETPKYAEGGIIENLGLQGDLNVESVAILKEFCLDSTPYDNDISHLLPKTNQIPDSEYLSRKDLRKECIFTIDPLTAKDLDDAVSCIELPNGNYEIGVHISDASYYLVENTVLDQKVQKKATTIYMVERAYHMLPVELCLHCSLLPGCDKLAFSVFWEMTPTGTIISQHIARTIVNSCAQLAYEHAQLMIENPKREFTSEELPQIHHGFTANDLSRVVNNLHKIALILRENRIKNGCLKIDQIKIGFQLDPQTGMPVDYQIAKNFEAHRLIEEFMLLANMTVADVILKKYSDIAFLRLHEPPKQVMLEELQKSLETVGIHVDISSSMGINKSLENYVGPDFLGKTRSLVLNHLFAKPMTRAKYFCAGNMDEDTEPHHYALNVPLYTHFTSPIRRYADIMVHRLVAACLDYRSKPEWDLNFVAEIAEICNRQKYNAKKAGTASSDLYLAHYIEQRQPVTEAAVVVDTKERSIDLIVLSTGSVIRIYPKDFGENVSWKSEQIHCTVTQGPEENTKKFWRFIVKFNATKTEPALEIILEMFTVVPVALTRKPKTYKLQAQLLRP